MGREDNHRPMPWTGAGPRIGNAMPGAFPALLLAYLRHPMRWSLPCLLTVALIAPRPSYAQGNVRDTAIPMVVVTASYAYQLPSGDMALRFGANNNVGLSACRKFKSNYMLGMEGSFLFGNEINESNLLRGVLNSDGQVIDRYGQPSTVFLYERGYTIMAYAGKIIPVAGPNPNSGLLIKVGGGYMRHKVRIETQINEVPQIEGEYLKGYDRLCAGPAALLFFGYQHISSNRLVNFMVGFESTLGFTRSLRPYNFDTGPAESGTRFDGLNGFRLGWSLPIYHRQDDTFYIR